MRALLRARQALTGPPPACLNFAGSNRVNVEDVPRLPTFPAARTLSDPRGRAYFVFWVSPHDGTLTRILRMESVQQGAAVQVTIPDVGVFRIPIVRRPGRPLPQGQLRTHAVCCGECPRHLTVQRRAAMSSHPAPPPVVGAADGSPARPPSCCGRSTRRTCGHAAAWDELVADRAEQAGLRVADVSRSSLAKLVRLYRLGAKVRAGLRQARRRRRSPRAGRTV
jgi:hypothetical protein